jgi:hypothetical protein
MPTNLELLDSLPGTGKTTAIFKYMSEHRQQPWLYLSPAASEAYDRAVEAAANFEMEIYIPTEESDSTKTEQILEFLEEGFDVACTHNLMLRFTKKHIEAIRKHKYNVVCDETLDLLSAYNIEKDDFDYLKSMDLISIDQKTGRVSYDGRPMGDKARYADVKLLCDLGCLFSAPRSERMLVTQLSTDLIRVSNRFILITYNYKNSLMDNFLSLHGFTYQNIEGVKTQTDNKEAKAKLATLLTFIETPSVKNIQKGSSTKLSKSWWLNRASNEDKDAVIKAIASCITKAKASKKQDTIFTLPKDIVKKPRSNSYEMKSTMVSKESWLACNTRATNNYADAFLAVQAYNLFPNAAVLAYLQDMGCKVDNENYALNMLIQWLWRGCIRKGEPMHVALLSKRMSVIFKEWLVSVDLE